MVSHRRRGTFLILLVAGLGLLLGVVALVTDVGYAYAERQRVQGVLDAAVLATMATLDAGDVDEAQTATRRVRKILAANGVDPDGLADVGLDLRRLGATLRAVAKVKTAAFLGAALGLQGLEGEVGAAASGDLAGPPAPKSPGSRAVEDVCGGCPGEPKECSELRNLVADASGGTAGLEALGSKRESQPDAGPQVTRIDGSRDWTFGGDDQQEETLDWRAAEQGKRIAELLRRVAASGATACAADPDAAATPPRSTGPYAGVRLSP